MTRWQLYNALKKFDYVAVRWKTGCVTGSNTKIALRSMVLKGFPADDTETRVMSFYPISFQEYIRIKTPL